MDVKEQEIDRALFRATPDDDTLIQGYVDKHWGRSKK